MKYLDGFLQNWRMRQAVRHITSDVRVIDIGAHNGELFQLLGKRLRSGFGVEPLLSEKKQFESYVLEPGFFPEVRPEAGNWDAITLLAVLEHIPRDQQVKLADACHQLLRIGGRVIITVPSPAVDHVLRVLKFLRLIDGMSLEEHFGFKPEDTTRIFSKPRFTLMRHARFQCGLNNLYVFEKGSP
jgi:SAM-dependent methyltransferase